MGGRPRRLRGARGPPRPSRRTRRLALAVGGGAVALAIGLSPAGAKVADLVGDAVGIGEPDAKPALRSLPAAGDLLVSSPAGVWVVGDDGAKRLLGDYEDATWSPNAVYVAATTGRDLVALEPDGDVRWTYTAPGEVRDPRWAGTSVDTRIAYRSGSDLRVIVGDGNGDTDHLIARDVAPVAPAWRPVAESKLDGATALGPYVLSYVDGSGGVRTVDADTGERVEDEPRGPPATRAAPALVAKGRVKARALSPVGPKNPRDARAPGAHEPPVRPGARSAAGAAAVLRLAWRPHPARPGRRTAACCWSAGPRPTSG